NRADEYRQLARDCLKLANMVPPGPPRDILIDTAQQWARLAEEQDRATDLRKKNRPPQLAASSVGRVSAASNAELGLMGTQFSEVACLLLSGMGPYPARDHHSPAAENRRTKSGFSFANGECVTHMRQGFPVQRLFAAPLRSICPAAL